MFVEAVELGVVCDGFGLVLGLDAVVASKRPCGSDSQTSLKAPIDRKKLLMLKLVYYLGSLFF